MKYLEQKPGHLWWKQNHRYTLYIVRELSAILIVLGLFSILALFIDNNIRGTKVLEIGLVYQILGFIGLIGSVIHSLTWLYVMPKISPIAIPKIGQIILYFFLIGTTAILTIGGVYYWLNSL